MGPASRPGADEDLDEAEAQAELARIRAGRAPLTSSAGTQMHSHSLCRQLSAAECAWVSLPCISRCMLECTPRTALATACRAVTTSTALCSCSLARLVCAVLQTGGAGCTLQFAPCALLQSKAVAGLLQTATSRVARPASVAALQGRSMHVTS